MGFVHINNRKFSLDGYAFESIVGEGASSTVYLIRSLLDRQKYVVKIFHRLLEHDDSQFRFSRECKYLAEMDHPNIIKVENWGVSHNLPYLILDYCQGKTLTQWVREHDLSNWVESVHICSKVFKALGYCHEKNIIHRDVKPDNIIINDGNEPILLDFGLARSDLMNTNQTDTGVIVGTIAYMDPELLSGASTGEANSDAYSMACVLYYTLTGRPPYTDHHPNGTPLSLIEHVREISKGQYLPPHRVNSFVPTELSQYLCSILKKKHLERADTDCVSISSRLDQFLVDPRISYSGSHTLTATTEKIPRLSTAARRVASSASVKVETPPSRHFLRLILITLILFVLGAIIIYSLLWSDRNEVSPENMALNNQFLSLGRFAIKNHTLPLVKKCPGQMIPLAGKIYAIELSCDSRPLDSIKIFQSLINGDAVRALGLKTFCFRQAHIASVNGGLASSWAFYDTIAESIFTCKKQTTTDDEREYSERAEECFYSLPPRRQAIHRLNAVLNGFCDIKRLSWNLNEAQDAVYKAMDFAGATDSDVESFCKDIAQPQTICNSPYLKNSDFSLLYPEFIDETSVNDKEIYGHNLVKIRELGISIFKASLINYILLKTEFLNYCKGTIPPEIEDFYTNEFQRVFSAVEPMVKESQLTQHPLISPEISLQKPLEILVDIGVRTGNIPLFTQAFKKWNSFFDARLNGKERIEDCYNALKAAGTLEKKSWGINAITNPEPFEKQLNDFKDLLTKEIPFKRYFEKIPLADNHAFFVANSLYSLDRVGQYDYCPELVEAFPAIALNYPLLTRLMYHSFTPTIPYLRRFDNQRCTSLITKLMAQVNSGTLPVELETLVALQTAIGATENYSATTYSNVSNNNISSPSVSECMAQGKAMCTFFKTYSYFPELDEKTAGLISILRRSNQSGFSADGKRFISRELGIFANSLKSRKDKERFLWMLGHSMVYVRADAARLFVPEIEKLLGGTAEKDINLKFPLVYLYGPCLYRADTTEESEAAGAQVHLAKKMMQLFRDIVHEISPERLLRFSESFMNFLSCQNHEITNDLVVEFVELLRSPFQTFPPKVFAWFELRSYLKLTKFAAPVSNSDTGESIGYRDSFKLEKKIIPRQLRLACNSFIEISKRPQKHVPMPLWLVRLHIGKICHIGEWWEKGLKNLDLIDVTTVPPNGMASVIEHKIFCLLGIIKDTVIHKDSAKEKESRARVRTLLDQYDKTPGNTAIFYSTAANSLKHPNLLNMALSLSR